MILHIPPRETQRWSGPYLGNYYGDLWRTFNVDLDRSDGKIGLSRRLTRIEDSTEVGGNTMTTFLRTNADCEDRYWALQFNSYLVNTDSAAADTVIPDRDWDADPLDSTPTASCYDMAVIGNDSRNDSGRNKLFVTTDCDIAVLNDTGNSQWTASWWRTKQSQPALNRNVHHPIEFFPFRKIGLVGDGNLVHTISRLSDTQNDTVTYGRLTLPSQYAIRHIMVSEDRAWFLTRHKTQGEAIVAEWDGYSESYNYAHRGFSSAILTGTVHGDMPILLNSAGQFLEYTGAGFAPMERNGQAVALPFLEEEANGFAIGTDSSASWAVSPRGMIVGEDGLIYVNVYVPTYRSFRGFGGVYALNPSTGRLYNKFSLGRYTDSTTAFDFGQLLPGSAGALFPLSPSSSQRGFLAGGTVRTNSGSTVQGGIWVLDNGGSSETNRGYFITQYIQAENVKEAWDELWLRFKQMRTSGESILVKARGVNPLVTSTGQPIEYAGTWASTTSLQVTSVSGDDELKVGDEVEVIAGNNAGYTSHITAISGTHPGALTLTVDETMGIGSGTCRVRFERWKKLKTITSNSVYEENINVGIDSSFIQFKVELRGAFNEMEVAELIVKSKQSV